MTTTTTFDKDLVITKSSNVVWYPFGFKIKKLWFINTDASYTKFLLRSGDVVFKVSVYDDHIDIDLLNAVGGRKADCYFANNFPIKRLCKRLLAGRRRYGFSIGDINNLRSLVSDFLKTLK